MKIDSIKQNNTNPQNFGALKKVYCPIGWQNNAPCIGYEAQIADELRKLADKHDFFKNNNVNANIFLNSDIGAKLVLKYKPVAKNFMDRIRNLFAVERTIKISEKYRCPMDATYYMGKRLRSMQTGNELNDLVQKAEHRWKTVIY